MAVVGVDAARADQADDVEPAVRSRARDGTPRAARAARRTSRRRSRRRSAAGPGAPAGRRRGSGGRPRSCPSGRAAGRPRPRRRASGACGQRGEQAAPGRHRRRGDRVDAPGRDRSRSRRGRRGRWAAAGACVTGGHAAQPRAPGGRGRPAPTMPAISSGLSDAPPTSAPSIAGSARNSPMLADGDAAAVEDGQVGRAVAPSPASASAAPDRVGHRRRIGARGVPAGADRPDRLVGDDQAGGREGGRVVRRRARRAAGVATTSSGSTGLALRELLADAQDRRGGPRRPPDRACGRSARRSRRRRGGAPSGRR